MTILLDIDGVLVTVPAWRSVKLLSDGFLEFNERAVKNLIKLINETKASIVLTTTHRFNYSVPEWKELLKTRGINPSSISKVNELESLSDIAYRSVEIEQWINLHTDITNYVIIDDDLSLNGLPLAIKQKCVLTKPLIGLDDEATEKAFKILLNT